MCIACGQPASSVCEACAATLVKASDRFVGGVLAVAAFEHRSAAKRMVANLKYRGSLAIAAFFAANLAPLVPQTATGVVPVPRALARRVKFGVDPAGELAAALAAEIGVPVVPALRAPIWWPSHARRGRADRRAVRFTLRAEVPEGCIVVDDVLTTGTTVRSALGVLAGGRISVATATAAGRMASGANSVPALGGGVARKRQSIPQRFTAAHSTTAPFSMVNGGFMLPAGRPHPREEDG